MPFLTAMVLGGFAAYAAAWYLGAVEGNFALLLLCATVITGVFWLAERLHFLPQREKAARALEQDALRFRSELAAKGIAQVDGDIEEAKHRVLQQPWWLDWTAGLFPVIVAVFVLRSFLFEPFKIPSGSMIPTLLIGDMILVNKFAYGVRLPVINTKVFDVGSPQRGDVMVFRYPPKPSLDYIKRVVALPGDEVAYLNKKLSVNGQAVALRPVAEFFDTNESRYYKQFEEKLGDTTHRLLVEDNRPAFIAGVEDFPQRNNCRYSVEGVVCKVPAGHYFLMGDNRDNSLDSRYWGFVPEQNIVGKAFFIWMNFSDIKRFGSFD
ncbi:MAG: signal peptidase I [Burkholderiaceae bacterium]